MLGAPCHYEVGLDGLRGGEVRGKEGHRWLFLPLPFPVLRTTPHMANYTLGYLVIVGKRIRYHDPLSHPSSRGVRYLGTGPGARKGCIPYASLFPQNRVIWNCASQTRCFFLFFFVTFFVCLSG